VILALSAAIAGLVFAHSWTSGTVYQSTATLDVISGTTKGAQPVTQEEVDILTGRYAALADSSSVLRDAIDTSLLNISVDTARERVSASVPPGRSGFITVRATGPSSSSAHALASGVVDSLGSTGQNEQNVIQVVSEPTTPPGPIAPTPTRDALLAFLIALVINSELFALFGYLGGRLTRGSESDDVERVTGVPVLALIPRQREAWVTEAFRTLRARIDQARADQPVRTIAVIGAEPGSGASFVAIGLAKATANLKMGVVLVDANLRRPAIAAELHVPEKPGLVEMVGRGTVEWDELPLPNPAQTRFRIVPAGEDVADPPGVLGSDALRKLLDQLQDADQVVVDSAAADEAIDALVIAAQCDAAILVIDANRARRRVLENAVHRIDQPSVELLGTVVNRVEADERTRPPRRRRRTSTP
jgi:capsular exopolysaccharide synthesis family protein